MMSLQKAGPLAQVYLHSRVSVDPHATQKQFEERLEQAKVLHRRLNLSSRTGLRKGLQSSIGGPSLGSGKLWFRVVVQRDNAVCRELAAQDDREGPRIS